MQQLMLDGPGRALGGGGGAPTGRAGRRPRAARRRAHLRLDVGVLRGRFPLEGPYPLGHEGRGRGRAPATRTTVSPGRPCRRHLPDLVRRVRTVPAGPHRQLRDAPPSCRPTVSGRWAGSNGVPARRPRWPCPTPTPCWCRCPAASTRLPSPARATTCPMRGGRSDAARRRARRRGPGGRRRRRSELDRPVRRRARPGARRGAGRASRPAPRPARHRRGPGRRGRRRATALQGRRIPHHGRRQWQQRRPALRPQQHRLRRHLHEPLHLPRRPGAAAVPDVPRRLHRSTPAGRMPAPPSPRSSSFVAGGGFDPSLVTSAVVPRTEALEALRQPPMKLVIDCTTS